VIKKTSIFILVVAAGYLIWTAFALWTGIYSVYSIPPGKEHPNGTTLLVSREYGEPLFNSPDYKEPPREVSNQPGLGFAAPIKSKKPLVVRTILELPYIEWAYKKSLEPQAP